MSVPIRIIHVFGSLNMGGAETMVMNIYRKIDKERIQFDFIVHGDEIGDYEDEIEKLGGRIYCIPKYKILNHILYKKAWKKFFDDHKEYRIIHSHVRSTASIFLNIAKKNNLITISHSHSNSNGKGIASIVKNLLQKRIRFVADYFFACSKESAIWLFGKKAANSKRCFIIKNSIDSKKFIYNEKCRKKVREELKINNEFVIGQVGRFVDVKNHEFTLKLFEEYLKKCKNSKLLLVGDGPNKNKIEQIINKKGLDEHVILLSSRNDVNELMNAMDLFIMPSKYEGLPLTLVEAQASSLPCIISDTIISGILDKKLVKQISLSSSTSNWIELIETCKKYKRINQSELINKNNFDIDENVKWLEKFYLNIK